MMNTHEKIRGVLLVDDKEENVEAGTSALIDFFPNAKHFKALSALKAIEILRENHDSIDFVISDMMMEKSDSGHEVAFEAWSWGIPSTIVSAGYGDHGGYHSVSISHPRNSIDGGKSSKDVWLKVLDVLFSPPEFRHNILPMLIDLRFKFLEKGGERYSDTQAELMTIVTASMRGFRLNKHRV